MRKHGVAVTWFFVVMAVVIVTGATGCEAAGKKSGKDPVQARKELGAMNVEYSPKAFGHAAMNGDKLAVELFLDAGMDVNAVGGIALILASEEGRAEIVKLLLGKGADVNAKDQYGRTALYAASANGHAGTLKLLLGKGADVNVKAGDGVALILAPVNGHTETLKLLLGKGADVNTKNSDGETVLMHVLLAGGGPTESVKLLLDKGADVNVKAGDGTTALSRAAYQSRTEIVQLLKNAGAK